MKTQNVNDFDRVVQNVVKEKEKKHNCIIFLQTDGTYEYMSIAYLNMTAETDVKLCTVNESKYTMASAIRNHFNGKEQQ